MHLTIQIICLGLIYIYKLLIFFSYLFSVRLKKTTERKLEEEKKLDSKPAAPLSLADEIKNKLVTLS